MNDDQKGLVERFLPMKGRALRAALAAGHPIEPAALDDTEYAGISLGLPAWMERLSWKTFRKTFRRDPDTGALRGWNVRMEQHGIGGPAVPKQKRGEPWTFGHYLVREAKGVRMPGPYDQALLIDYDVPRNAFFGRRVRDPLVAVEPGRVDALLGWSYVDLGVFRVGTPSFFLLLREGPLSFVP